MMGAALGLQAIGAGVSAMGTLAGGNYAATAGQLQQQAAAYEAKVLREQASTEQGIGQQRGLEDRYKTSEYISRGRAVAAASGVDPGFGSPVAATGALKQRGELEAMRDIWTGQNRAVQLRNQASGAMYSGNIAAYAGEAQQSLSRYSALGTILGGAGSMFRTYGAFEYPSTYVRAMPAFG